MPIEKIGKHTYGTQGIKIFYDKWSKVNIGSFCSFAENISIYLDANHIFEEWLSTWPFGVLEKDVFTNPIASIDFLGPHGKWKKDINIGSDVWVGANVTIMGGVNIGHGSIIATNSHVVKDIEPYSIVGGNPAKLIRLRHEKPIINELLKVAWWDWEDEKINSNLHLICQSDPLKLIKAFKDSKV